jgi:gamma-glutamyltranspeptidase/glutathione hydrolase
LEDFPQNHKVNMATKRNDEMSAVRAITNRSFRIKPTNEQTFYPRVFGRNGAVAAHHYLSAQAAIDMLRLGGTAVDAAVAATLVEGVVNPQMHTIGGEIAMLIAAPGEAPVAINGNMVAPEGATPEEFRKRGFEKIPPEGVLAAGVPGVMGALIEALVRFGRLSFSAVVLPALTLCREGFPAHSGLVRQHKFGIADNAEKFRRGWPGSSELYLPGGAVPEEGSLLKNPALGEVYDHLSRVEARNPGDRARQLGAVFDEFYKGEIAREIAAFVTDHDGLLAASDLGRFQVPVEEPASLEFAGATVFKCGPWSQGPALLQILSILKTCDLRSLGHNSSEYIHVVVEAMKLAFADRDQYYGDPTQISVPLSELLSDAYGQMRAALIEREPNSELRPGDPLAMQPLLTDHKRFGGDAWGPGTVQIDVMDKDGLVAAFTPSGAWIMQSEVVSALGFPLGVRLSNSVLGPQGHPNVVAPFRRPRTTISPTLVTKDNRPWLAFGSMGGDQQDQWQLQMLLNRLVFDMPLQRAIEAPKFSSEHFPGFFHPHDSFRNRLRIEESVGSDVLAELSTRGHDLDIGPAWSEGFISATERHPNDMLEAGVDPRGTKSEVFPACALAY